VAQSSSNQKKRYGINGDSFAHKSKEKKDYDIFGERAVVVGEDVAENREELNEDLYQLNNTRERKKRFESNSGSGSQ